MADKQPKKRPIVPPAPVPQFKKPPSGIKPPEFTAKRMTDKREGKSLSELGTKGKYKKVPGQAVQITEKEFGKSPAKFTMKNMDYWKSKAGIDLTKKPVGPRATPKPFDRKKFEEETRVAQGMENVRAELFSDKSTHDKVKKNIKKKDQDFGFVNYEDPSDPDRN